MGQRANLVIVKADAYDLYYNHWCANTMPNEIFWGPEHTEAFIKIQEPVGPESWLDTTWAEGGVLLDQAKKTVLFFGGEDVLWDVPFRRLYLELMAKTWNGWDILWAYNGIVDLAAYVGVDPIQVMSSYYDQEDILCSLAGPDNREEVRGVASFRTEDGIKLYPLDNGIVEDYLYAGPKIIKECAKNKSYHQIRLTEWTDSFPVMGFHIDVPARSVEFWSATDTPDMELLRDKIWKDWSIQWQLDRFELQEASTLGNLQFNGEDDMKMKKRMKDMLSYQTKAYDVNSMLDALSENGQKDVQVNSAVYSDKRLCVDAHERQRILDDLL